MQITITARHGDLSDELRARARTVLERLERVAPRPHHGRVLFVADHGRPTAEVRLHVARGAVLVGTARGADLRTALDLAAAKIRRQLDKSPARRRGATRRGRTRGPR